MVGAHPARAESQNTSDIFFARRRNHHLQSAAAELNETNRQFFKAILFLIKGIGEDAGPRIAGAT